jgi:hypothetical protein
MKRIKLSISDESGNLSASVHGSPVWRNSTRYTWFQLETELHIKSQELLRRLLDWQEKTIKFNDLYSWEGKREELVKCEIEGLSILLELRKELPDYEITYSSNFNSYNCVLNEDKEDDY